MDNTTVTCPNCGSSSAAGKKFCAECGATLPLVCPTCGNPVTARAKFCDDCGAALQASVQDRRLIADGRPDALLPPVGPIPLTTGAPLTSAPSAPAAERRLITALFCDLVGFTPLSEQLDPEETRDIQAEYFGAMAGQIERYGGTVEKYAGDAVLALFGVPIVHEDDAERAVLCALRIQEVIAPVAEQARLRWGVGPAIRVGVNMGEVVSGTWDVGGRQDVAATGDAVNTAARIQGAAEPGEVLVGEEAMRLTQRRIVYGDRRDLVLKGKGATVPVYPALRVREQMVQRWEAHTTPLVGRERELAQLADVWMRARGGEGQVLTIVGDPGVGKSRLAAELIEREVDTGDASVVRARCLSYGQDIGLWLVADLLRGAFGIGEGAPVDEVREKLTASVMTFLARCPAETQADALDVLGEVLGLPPGNLAGAALRRQVTNRILRLLLAGLAERVPTMIVLEDLHWIDAASQEVLTEALVDVPGLQMLVLTTQRPGWTPPWSAWGWTERLVLHALPEADAALLAGVALGGARLAPALEQYLAERAGGNPFFVEELLHALKEAGGLVEQGEQMQLVPGAAERLPSTLTGILLARLDRLESQVRAVAQVASVIGRSFAVRLLASVMEREQTTLEMPLTALQQAEIAFPRRGSDLEYMFKHVTMREVAYNTLIQKRRRQLHLATARAIAQLYSTDEYAEMIAHHYARTDEHREAAGWLERAGQRAVAIYANESAIVHLREARKRLDLCAAAEGELAGVDAKLAEVLARIGKTEEASEMWRRAEEEYRRVQDLEGMGLAGAELAGIDANLGHWDAAWQRADALVGLLSAAGPSVALARVHNIRADGFVALGRHGEALEAAAEAARAADTVDDDREWLRAEEMRGRLLALAGEVDEPLSVLKEVARRAEQNGFLDTAWLAVNDLGCLALNSGHPLSNRSLVEWGIKLARRSGNPASRAWIINTLGEILMYAGEWDEARAWFQQALEIHQAADNPLTSWPAAMNLGYLDVLSGRWEETRRSLEPVNDFIEQRGREWCAPRRS